jgi:hypothetical protein
MCTHKGFPRTVKTTAALAKDNGVHGYSIGSRERLGSPETTSRLERGKGRIGRAFATRVRRITDHLKFKISHIRFESRDFCDQREFGGSPLLQQGEQRFSAAERNRTLICALALALQKNLRKNS